MLARLSGQACQPWLMVLSLRRRPLGGPLGGAMEFKPHHVVCLLLQRLLVFPGGELQGARDSSLPLQDFQTGSLWLPPVAGTGAKW